MSLAHTLAVFEALDSPQASGDTVRALLDGVPGVIFSSERVTGAKGATDFVRVIVPGARGRRAGGEAPTLGVVGRLGGVGARPARVGLVSDADGAVAAIAVARKLAFMRRAGDVLAGDVVIATHVCPDAPTKTHVPVDFMDSPVSIDEMNAREVSDDMAAVLSIDTTKGNRILNVRGFALSPTVKEGWILKVAPDLVRLAETSSGQPAVTFPITMQDITPYGNGVDHLNSILQPATATTAPVVGVAIAAATTVPGCATGASHEVDIAAVVRFVIEVAKEVGTGTCRFHDQAEFAR
ncbi:MAG TPA: DUF1177 domain-containing protein, partial [Vicinamibacterales bacterium]|nr:DUF1177 domain-containing protein [Vicinamibacterales bacterium]